MAKRNQLVIDRVKRLTAFSKTTGKALYMLTEVEDLQTSITTEEKTAVDSQGTTVATFEMGKSGTISGNASFVNFGLLEAQNGSTGVAADGSAVLFPMYEEGTISSQGGTFTLSHEPQGAAGSQVKYIYVIQPDGTLGEAFAQSSSVASASEFGCSGSTITAPTNAPAGTKYGVFYEYAPAVGEGTRYDNNSTDYSAACILKIDVICADVCNTANLTAVTIQCNNAKLSSAYDITWGTDAKHPFEFKMDTDYCGTTGKNLFSTYVPE